MPITDVLYVIAWLSARRISPEPIMTPHFSAELPTMNRVFSVTF